MNKEKWEELARHTCYIIEIMDVLEDTMCNYIDKKHMDKFIKARNILFKLNQKAVKNRDK